MFIGLRLHLQNGLRVRGYVYRVTVKFPCTKWAGQLSRIDKMGPT